MRLLLDKLQQHTAKEEMNSESIENGATGKKKKHKFNRLENH